MRSIVVANSILLTDRDQTSDIKLSCIGAYCCGVWLADGRC